MSFSTSNGATAKGEPLANVAKECLLRDTDRQIVAMGVNCCPASDVGLSLKLLQNPEIPLVAYPNRRNTLGEDLPKYLPEWIRLNATLVGACCGFGPNDIRRMAEALREYDKT